MANVATLRKKAADFEQKKQLDKAVAAYREILDIFEKTTGGRIIHSVNRIGGVRRDVSDSELTAIVGKLTELGKAFEATSAVFAKDPSIRHRLSDVGVLSAEDARAVDAVGPMARASRCVRARLVSPTASARRYRD